MALTHRQAHRDDRMEGGNGTDTAFLIDWNGNAPSFLTSYRGTITLGEGDAVGTAVLQKSTLNFITRTTTTTTIETDTLLTVENVVGSDFADTITGNSAANTLAKGATATTFSMAARDPTSWRRAMVWTPPCLRKPAFCQRKCRCLA